MIHQVLRKHPCGGGLGMREPNASLRSQAQPCGFDPLFGRHGGRLPGHILAVSHRAPKFLLRQPLLLVFCPDAVTSIASVRPHRSSRFMSDARAGVTRRAPAAPAERMSPAPCAAPAWWL